MHRPFGAILIISLAANIAENPPTQPTLFVPADKAWTFEVESSAVSDAASIYLNAPLDTQIDVARDLRACAPKPHIVTASTSA